MHRAALIEASGLFWIRTWFGNEDVSREEADSAYARLCDVVMEEIQVGDEIIERPWLFEDESRFADRSGKSETYTGVIPSYVLEAFCDYPDRLESSVVTTEELERISYLDENPQEEQEEYWLVVVADREACEQGTVLFMEVGQFGAMLSGRLRVPPRDVVSRINCYRNGQTLSLETEGAEGVIHAWCEGDPWDYGAPS